VAGRTASLVLSSITTTTTKILFPHGVARGRLWWGQWVEEVVSLSIKWRVDYDVFLEQSELADHVVIGSSNYEFMMTAGHYREQC